MTAIKADYHEPQNAHEELVDSISNSKLNLIREIFEIYGDDLGNTPVYTKYKNYLANDIINLLPDGLGMMAFNDFTTLDPSYYANASLSGLTLEQLAPIFNGCNKAYLGACLTALQKYGDKIGLNNKGKLFVLAQLGHESGNFRYTAEIGKGKGKAYGLPAGPYKKLYYGRGPIQITWEANYKKISQSYFPSLGINADIWANPDLCESNLEIGCAASLCWFLIPGNGKRAVQYANAGDINGLTKMINGGYNGLSDRTKITESLLRLASTIT